MRSTTVGSDLLTAWGQVYDFSSPILDPAPPLYGNMISLYKYNFCYFNLHYGNLIYRMSHLKQQLFLEIWPRGTIEMEDNYSIPYEHKFVFYTLIFFVWI
jgi:hypothetical protein